MPGGELTEQNAASTPERRCSISSLSDARRAQDNESNRSVGPLVRWFVGLLVWSAGLLDRWYVRLYAGDMRVESHNQKFNNGCTKGSTKRVDVHIFYEFYTDTANGFVLYLTDAHAAGRQAGRPRDRQTHGQTGLQAFHLLQRKAQRRNNKAYEVIKQEELPRRKWLPFSESDAQLSPAAALTTTGSDT